MDLFYFFQTLGGVIFDPDPDLRSIFVCFGGIFPK